jgi:hypothetical protein
VVAVAVAMTVSMAIVAIAVFTRNNSPILKSIYVPISNCVIMWHLKFTFEHRSKLALNFLSTILLILHNSLLSPHLSISQQTLIKNLKHSLLVDFLSYKHKFLAPITPRA